MVLVLAALCSVANAWESEPQNVLVTDSISPYSDLTLDTDWLPADSPIAVRFQVDALGGATVEMAGIADLYWPEGLNLSFTGSVDEGLLLVDATFAAVTSVRFDVFGYSWESEIDRRELSVEGKAAFTPFLLSGADPASVEAAVAGTSTSVVEYDLEVFTGVTIAFDATMTPEGTVSLTGEQWQVDEQELTEEDGSLLLTATGEPTLDVEATWVGTWTAGLALVFVPTVSVCVIVYGCEELASFDIPLELAAYEGEQAAPAVPLSFPLPVLEVPATSYDFGEVEVGTLANLELPLANAGALDLEGEAGVIGSSYFTVYPGYFLAGYGAEDGVVVTFAPETEGTFTGTLLLTSNDPAYPTLEVALSGTGVVPGDTGEPVDDKILSTENNCGCAAAPPRSTAGLAVLLGLLYIARRREG